MIPLPSEQFYLRFISLAFFHFCLQSGAMKKEAKLNSAKQKLKKKKSSLKQPEKAAKKVKTKKAAASTT